MQQAVLPQNGRTCLWAAFSAGKQSSVEVTVEVLRLLCAVRGTDDVIIRRGGAS